MHRLANGPHLRAFSSFWDGRPAVSAPWPARRIIISHLVTDQRTRSFAASAATNQCEPAVSGWFSPRTPRRRFSPARRPRRIFVRMLKKNATRPVRCIRHHRRPFSAASYPPRPARGLRRATAAESFFIARRAREGQSGAGMCFGRL